MVSASLCRCATGIHREDFSDEEVRALVGVLRAQLLASQDLRPQRQMQQGARTTQDPPAEKKPLSGQERVEQVLQALPKATLEKMQQILSEAETEPRSPSSVPATVSDLLREADTIIEAKKDSPLSGAFSADLLEADAGDDGQELPLRSATTSFSPPFRSASGGEEKEEAKEPSGERVEPFDTLRAQANEQLQDLLSKTINNTEGESPAPTPKVTEDVLYIVAECLADRDKAIRQVTHRQVNYASIETIHMLNEQHLKQMEEALFFETRQCFAKNFLTPATSLDPRSCGDTVTEIWTRHLHLMTSCFSQWDHVMCKLYNRMTWLQRPDGWDHVRYLVTGSLSRPPYANTYRGWVKRLT